jgi:GAF domain-containing protein
MIEVIFKIFLTDYIDFQGFTTKRIQKPLLIEYKQNDNVVGIIEIASLQMLTEKQQSFVERIAEILAGSIINAQNNEKMRRMLAESQILAENLRAQEEEMRQNLEELQATQEAMARRDKEIKRLIE